MEILESYLEDLNEDFGFQMKAFKAKVLQKMSIGIKKNVKGSKVNVPAIKLILKPIPVMTQDRINKFLSKYVPNYKENYNTAERHFKNKYPTGKNIDTLAGATAIMASMDKDSNLQQQIKRSDRVYSSTIGSSGGGGAFVMFVVGLGIVMAIFSIDFLVAGTVWLAALLGIFLMLVSVLSLAGD